MGQEQITLKWMAYLPQYRQKTTQMAARKRAFHNEQVRERIKASQLVNRLRDNALAEREIMSPGQIQSARILLDRVLPALATVTHKGDADNPLQTRVTVAWERVDATKDKSD